MPKRVPTHRPFGTPTPEQNRRLYESQASRREDQAFYKGRPWSKLRLCKLADCPLCEPCKAQGRDVPAEHVHHVKDRKTHPDLALDYDNLESVCLPCHNAKRKRKS